MVDNKKRLFKKEYSKELLFIAMGDLKSAKSLASSKDPGRLENIIFHAQQSIEKAIKSVLVYKQIAFPLVHDLGILVALLPDDSYPPNGFNLVELNQFASIKRYEAGSLPITHEDVKTSITVADDVMAWAQSIIKF